MATLANKLLRKRKLPIEFVGARIEALPGSSSTRSVNLTGLTGGLASAPAAGDFVLVIFAAVDGGNNDINLSVTDYTELVDLYANDSEDAQLGLYWKFMGGTPDTTCTISSTGHADNAAVVGISVWRNVNTTTPIDVTTTTATGTNTGHANPPSITPVTAGAYVVAAGAGAQYFLFDARIFTSSDLTGFRSAQSLDNNDVLGGFGYKAWTSGAFDPAAFGYSTGSDSLNDSWCAATVALRPA